MKYAGIIKNDFAAAPGVCLSFFVQGCPIQCKGCHNADLQDFTKGKELTSEVINDIIKSLKANNIMRTFCLMGGEPLCDENILTSLKVVEAVRKAYPQIKIYIWTGYILEELQRFTKYPNELKTILHNANYLIDGPYIEKLRDITLPLRGSSNQRIIELK